MGGLFPYQLNSYHWHSLLSILSELVCLSLERLLSLLQVISFLSRSFHSFLPLSKLLKSCLDLWILGLSSRTFSCPSNCSNSFHFCWGPTSSSLASRACCLYSALSSSRSFIQLLSWNWRGKRSHAAIATQTRTRGTQSCRALCWLREAEGLVFQQWIWSS